MISASFMKSRACGEISTVPSFPIGVCSPPVPRTESPSGVATFLASVSVPSLVRFGSFTWTDARMPVPRLDGHDVTYPYLSERANLIPSSDSTASKRTLRRSNTSFSFVPFFMHMIRSWSSSPNHMIHCLSAACQQPRPYGQSDEIPALLRNESASMSWGVKLVYLTCSH